MGRDKLESVLSNQVHPFGKWQIFLFFFVAIASDIPMPMIPQLANLQPEYVCSEATFSGWSYQQVLNYYSSLYRSVKENSSVPNLRCQRPNLSIIFQNAENSESDISMAINSSMLRLSSDKDLPPLEKCLNGPWVFDSENAPYRHSLIEDFKLVCDRQKLIPYSSAWYSVGMFLGCIFGGQFADRFGRKRVLSLSMPLFAVTAISLFWCNQYYIFVLLRLVVAFFNSLGFMTGSAYIYEITDHNHRNTMTIIRGLFSYLIAQNGFIGISYLLQDWRWVHMIGGLISLISVLYCCILPESPRWLIDQGKYDEAVEILRRAALVNGRSRRVVDSITVKLISPETVTDEISSSDETMCRKILLSFSDWISFLTDRECVKLWIPLSWIWMTISCVYYTISFLMVRLPWNPYVIAVLGTVIMIPARCLLWLLYKKFDRRKPMIGLLIVSTFCCATASVLIAFDLLESIVISLAVVIIGLSATLLDMVALYTSELFFTDQRIKALGFLSAIARVGMFLGFFIEQLDSTVWRPLPTMLMTFFLLISVICGVSTRQRDVMSTSVVLHLQKDSDEEVSV